MVLYQCSLLFSDQSEDLINASKYGYFEMEGHTMIVNRLIKADTDTNKANSDKSKQPLEIPMMKAASRGHQAIVQLLIETMKST